MFGLSEPALDFLRQTFSRYPEIQEVVVFGSRAMGNQKKASDIDLAVKGDAIHPDILFQIRNQIDEESTLPYFMDLLDYQKISFPELKNHIDTHGKTLYARR